MSIVFRRLEKADLAAFRSWFEDAELARRLSYPTDDWFAHVTGPIARCWIGLDDNGAIVAQVQVDRAEAGRGYIDFAVRPDLRGQGLGAAALGAFVSGPGRVYLILEGRIAPDNIASLTCARHCGFELLPELDEDGFVRVVRRTS